MRQDGVLFAIWGEFLAFFGRPISTLRACMVPSTWILMIEERAKSGVACLPSSGRSGAGPVRRSASRGAGRFRPGAPRPPPDPRGCGRGDLSDRSVGPGIRTETIAASGPERSRFPRSPSAATMRARALPRLRSRRGASPTSPVRPQILPVEIELGRQISQFFEFGSSSLVFSDR